MSQRDVKEYPSNSLRTRVTIGEQPVEEKRVVSKVISGEVKSKKKSVWTKAKVAFFGEETIDVGEYLMYDVLIPSAKELVDALISSIKDAYLWGGQSSTSNSRLSRRAGQSVFNYNSISSVRRNVVSSLNNNVRQAPVAQARTRVNLDDLVFTKRVDAEEVLANLRFLIEQYHVAGVSDLYSLIGMPTEYTDQKWGWDDLRIAEIRRVRDGYLLVLPQPSVI
jgi:hypothetical protein